MEGILDDNSSLTTFDISGASLSTMYHTEKRLVTISLELMLK